MFIHSHSVALLTMAFSGAKVIVVCCFFVHFMLFADFFLVQASTPVISFVSIIQAIVLLCYPVVGLLADTCFNRYNFIRVSLVSLLVSSLIGSAVEILTFVMSKVNSLLVDPTPWYILVMLGLFLTGVILSLGMFQATAIQFGMDQMVEASSDQVSAFIHWYYWSMSIGIGIQTLVTLVTSIIIGICTDNIQNKLTHKSYSYFLVNPLFPATIVVQPVACLVSFIILIRFKRHLTIEPAGHNQFTMVYKVLRYAWQHKCPERRSAFTYWEEDIPPRIDLGKSKYGGPFTTEQVENVKTFLQLFLVIISLFGFHLSDNGYSLIRQLNFKLCPTKFVTAGVSASPGIFHSVTVMVFIPVYHYLVLPRLYHYVPNMLHRLGIGTTLMLFQELAGMVIVLYSWEKYSKGPPVSKYLKVSPIGDCFLSNLYVLFNNTCIRPVLHSYCGQEDELFLLELIPIFSRAIAYHLVFMTALEFISAQAPLKMKGSLISIWYALSAQRYVVQTLALYVIEEDKDWLIFHGVKANVMLLSLLFYCCVAKRYSYRLRDEVVNEQYLVEEVYERELRLADEYEREKTEEMRLLYGHGSTYRYPC